MGIPSFARWLYEKYPKVIQTAVDNSFVDKNGALKLPNAAEPNPNGVEYDNLYIDMNGVVHPCCHPENGPVPRNEEEMFSNIRKYLLYIFSVVRPRKLLFMALDGVAPRAKMNQQRSRRYLSAQEKTEMDDCKQQLLKSWQERGKKVDADLFKKEWDSNVITPGTVFMHKLALNLREFLQQQIQTNASWRNIKVIFSDSSVPGEGEHKIMQFIRASRAQPEYNPNTRHCVHGLDADLFMLSLATHELRFSLLRENVMQRYLANKTCSNCDSKKHCTEKCPLPPRRKAKNSAGEKTAVTAEKKENFQFAQIHILREYLERELSPVNNKGWNFENAIDDFVFLCFFVGNDFLPHLPSLKIFEGAIDLIMRVYVVEIAEKGLYITESGKLNFELIRLLLGKIGLIEDAVFKKREEGLRNLKLSKLNKSTREMLKLSMNATAGVKRTQPLASELPQTQTRNQRKAELTEKRSRKNDSGDTNSPSVVVQNALDEAIANFDTILSEDKKKETKEENFENFSEVLSGKKKEMGIAKSSVDKVRLGKKGWKGRYYEKKLGAEFNEKTPSALFLDLLSEYMRGLEWVYCYYTRKCPSWEWYFPFHYAPFASDLARLSVWERSQSEGKPLSPMAQLMGVMPPASSHCLPSVLAGLMDDPESPLADFYPETFELDTDGVRFNWQGVKLLPFVNEKRLLDFITPKLESLTEEERILNSEGTDLVFMHSEQPFGAEIENYLKKGKENLIANGEAKGREETPFVCQESPFPEILAGRFSSLERFRNKETTIKDLKPLEGVSCFSYVMPPVLTYKNSIKVNTLTPQKTLSEGDHSKRSVSRRYGNFNEGSFLRFVDNKIANFYKKYSPQNRNKPFQSLRNQNEIMKSFGLRSTASPPVYLSRPRRIPGFRSFRSSRPVQRGPNFAPPFQRMQSLRYGVRYQMANFSGFEVPRYASGRSTYARGMGNYPSARNGRFGQRFLRRGNRPAYRRR